MTTSVSASDAPPILPPGPADQPKFEVFETGPLRIRRIPGQTKPLIGHYVQQSGKSADNLISALDRHGLNGFWNMMDDMDVPSREKYIQTARPIIVSQFIVPLHNRDSAVQQSLETKIDYWLANATRAYCGFSICEWENCFYRHWEPSTDPFPVFGVTEDQLKSMDRKAVWKVIAEAVRKWSQKARGHLLAENGYGMQSHIAEVGLEGIGIETSETIPSTQVKRAFARGAARQFGILWSENVSVWFGNTTSAGIAKAWTHPETACVRGGDAGHSPSMLERIWNTAWLSGAAELSIETSPCLLFEVPVNAPDFPKDPPVSRYGRRAAALVERMNTKDIGVPYTPFAVLIDKHSGRWSVWGKPWGRFDETVGDRMVVRFFDQIFPGQSQGPGMEERYLCPSPYGDTFDVIVNDANRTSWGAYPVILAVGDIAWTPDDIDFLKSYVAAGGILALNERNIGGWDRSYLGLADSGFSPAADAKVVLRSGETPLLMKREVGRGCIFVSAAKPEPGADEDRAFPGAFLDALAGRFLPVRIDGSLQTLYNRTKDGWIVTLVNNNGFSKQMTEPPVMDPSATRTVKLAYRGAEPIRKALLWSSNGDRELDSNNIQVAVPPGEFRTVQLILEPTK